MQKKNFLLNENRFQQCETLLYKSPMYLCSLSICTAIYTSSYIMYSAIVSKKENSNPCLVSIFMRVYGIYILRAADVFAIRLAGSTVHQSNV